MHFRGTGTPLSSSVLLEPSDIGALTLPTARGLHNNRDSGGTHHLSEGIGTDLAVAEVGVPIGAGVERIPGIVGVDQVDAAGNGLDPIDQADEFLATSVGVAGVETEANRVTALGLTN